MYIQTLYTYICVFDPSVVLIITIFGCFFATSWISKLQRSARIQAEAPGGYHQVPAAHERPHWWFLQGGVKKRRPPWFLAMMVDMFWEMLGQVALKIKKKRNPKLPKTPKTLKEIQEHCGKNPWISMDFPFPLSLLAPCPGHGWHDGGDGQPPGRPGRGQGGHAAGGALALRLGRAGRLSGDLAWDGGWFMV